MEPNPLNYIVTISIYGALGLERTIQTQLRGVFFDDQKSLREAINRQLYFEGFVLSEYERSSYVVTLLTPVKRVEA